MEIHPLGCRNLAVGICNQAAKDYRKSHGRDLSARDFFLHDRIFQTLNVDGEMILYKLNSELKLKKNNPREKRHIRADLDPARDMKESGKNDS